MNITRPPPKLLDLLAQVCGSAITDFFKNECNINTILLLSNKDTRWLSRGYIGVVSNPMPDDATDKDPSCQVGRAESFGLARPTWRIITEQPTD